MDLPSSWTFVLFTLCFVALIAGALLGFAVGFRTGGRQERFRLVKEKRGITRHEQEICCLVKWNFSRKEQLAVFNNTSEALTKSKNRLKKKLRLDEKVDLDQFIRLY